MERTGSYGPYEKEYVRKDGTLVPLRLNGMLVTGRNGEKRIWSIVEDITARRKAELQIARLSKWNELLLNSAGEGIYGVGLDGRCTFVNPTALSVLGFGREEVFAGRPHELFHHHHPDGSPYPQDDCPVFATLKDGLRRDVEDAFIRKNGEAFPVQITVTPMHEGGSIIGVAVVFQDIARRKAMESELTRLATTDSLTGVANRRRFLDQLEMELARIRRFGRAATLLMVDIDHFKKVNDTYGHAVGDTVLRHFAEISRQRLRRIDLFGRLGGEEFGILLPSTDGTGAWQFADRYRRKVAETPAPTIKGAIGFTVSIGIAEFDPGDPSPDSIMARADVALYRAKEGGRNRVEAS
jgi:diguanylate cyclase